VGASPTSAGARLPYGRLAQSRAASEALRRLIVSPGEGQPRAGCRKTGERGAKRTPIPGMGCSTLRMAHSEPIEPIDLTGVNLMAASLRFWPTEL